MIGPVQFSDKDQSGPVPGHVMSLWLAVTWHITGTSPVGRGNYAGAYTQSHVKYSATHKVGLNTEHTHKVDRNICNVLNKLFDWQKSGTVAQKLNHFVANLITQSLLDHAAIINTWLYTSSAGFWSHKTCTLTRGYRFEHQPAANLQQPIPFNKGTGLNTDSQQTCRKPYPSTRVWVWPG